MAAAANTEKLEGSNKSSGGNIGVSVGVGQNTGFSVFANANSSRGKENGDSTIWNNTTVDSGGKVTLHSGRDTTLKGAQVNGEHIAADIGRNLTMQSLQDIERYESQQTSVSGGVSIPIGAGSGSANLSASRDKVKSNFQSVREQTGLFAGKGGYDVKVKEHTQLDGAVIASTAHQDKNTLDTGTLGWSDIHNQADFKAEHSGGSLSTGGPVGADLMTNAAGGMLAGANNSGHAEGTTKAAVSQGRLMIRDQDSQRQDIAQLSRDTDNANGSIEPIFNKEKEQSRLQQAQLIGEIGSQTMDIIRTQGDIAGLKEAKAKHPTLGADELRKTKEYQKAMNTYGTGSDLQKAAQAVTGALTALAGNNLAGALASGASPYLATEIKQRVGEDNIAANAMAHAALGALTAQLNNQSALAGGLGAGGGELAARVITQQLFPGKTADQLSEGEKQQVSALSQLAAGLAGGLAIGDTGGAVTAAQAGKNAVENNLLGAVVGGAAESAAIAGAVGLGSQSGSNDDDGFDMGGDICEGTREQCAVRDGTRGPGRMENRGEESGEVKPNLGKDIAKATDTQKAELGGVGSGTPGGWGPGDEEKARNNDRKIITVEELTSTSSRGQETLGRSKLFERAGGKNAANKEFDALAPNNVKQIPGGRVGSLSDGRTVIIRERSTDGRPTLEIQSGRNRIKFRYDE